MKERGWLVETVVAVLLVGHQVPRGQAVEAREVQIKLEEAES